MKRICGDCNKPKPYTFLKTVRRKNGRLQDIHVDDRGVRWYGRICSLCLSDRAVKRGRISGKHRAIDDVSAHNLKKGRSAERLAATFLSKIGATNVRLTTLVGPDIIFDWPTKKNITAEVKSASRVAQTNCWTVHSVLPKRRSDHFIIYVHLESGRCWLRDMREHNVLAGLGGRLTITNLINGGDIWSTKPQKKRQAQN